MVIDIATATSLIISPTRSSTLSVRSVVRKADMNRNMLFAPMAINTQGYERLVLNTRYLPMHKNGMI
jgi:hypothetical protein